MKAIVTTKQMQDDVQGLPAHIQVRLKSLLAYLAQDILHPYLHTKPLKEQWKGYYSFRITRGYRCIFSCDAATITLHLISHRKDAYR
jgi:mRNA-degrading endonuclease RelE of RelBE toxin-antitoxin system